MIYNKLIMFKFKKESSWGKLGKKIKMFQDDLNKLLSCSIYDFVVINRDGENRCDAYLFYGSKIKANKIIKSILNGRIGVKLFGERDCVVDRNSDEDIRMVYISALIRKEVSCIDSQYYSRNKPDTDYHSFFRHLAHYYFNSRGYDYNTEAEFYEKCARRLRYIAEKELEEKGE